MYLPCFGVQDHTWLSSPLGPRLAQKGAVAPGGGHFPLQPTRGPILGEISPGKQSWTGPSSCGLTLQAIPLCPFAPSLPVSLQGELHSASCATRMCGGLFPAPRLEPPPFIPLGAPPTFLGQLLQPEEHQPLGRGRHQSQLCWGPTMSRPWDGTFDSSNPCGQSHCHLAPGAGLLVLHAWGYWCWAPGVNDAGRPGLLMLDALGY